MMRFEWSDDLFEHGLLRVLAVFPDTIGLFGFTGLSDSQWI